MYMEATLNKNENYTWKFVKIKNLENIMEFCHHGKMGTLELIDKVSEFRNFKVK